VRLSEVVDRYPATVALYAEHARPNGFGLFMIRTVSDVHGQGRSGVSVDVGSGGRACWTAEQVRAVAVRLLLTRALGHRRGPTSTTYAQLVGARWTGHHVYLSMHAGASILMPVSAELRAEHGETL
jgi:hypothetical protein